MAQLDERPVAAPPSSRRGRGRPSRLHWAMGGVLVVVMASGIFLWLAAQPPRAISVNEAVDRYRSASPQPAPSATGLPPAPATGVYVYATKGSEHISVGDVTHTSPARTAVTVTDTACGLQVRWDALEGRYMQWQLCGSPEGWRLRTYVDVHKFLYMTDKHDYACAGDPVVLPRSHAQGAWSVTCDTEGGQMHIAVTVVGSEQRQLDGHAVTTTHLTLEQHATGTSVNDGTTEMWLLEPTGLPVSVTVRNHGSQVVLGSHVTYDESAQFDLTSLKPRR